MLRIKVDGKYKNLIFSGKKTSTIRLGERNHKVGDLVELRTERGRFAKAVITDIEFKTIEELTKEDAHRDGFKSKKELLRAMKGYYRDLSGKELTIIGFRVRKKLNALEIAEQALKTLELSTPERVLCKAIIEYGSLGKAAKELGSLDLESYLKEIFQELEVRLSEHES
jgi:hypothetical protein